jgi:hypothetical protein
MKLNAKTIASLKLPAGRAEAFFWDEEFSGFGLRLRQSGGRLRRTWVIQYRTKAGQTRRITVASADELSAANARKHAGDVLAKIRMGGDPQGDKTAARKQAMQNLKTVAEEFLDFGIKYGIHSQPWRTSTVRQYRLILLIYFKPLHGMAIDTIKRADIAPVLTQIERERGRRSAVLARARLWTLFAWAIGEGRLDANPVVGTREIEYSVKRERVLTGEDRLASGAPAIPSISRATAISAVSFGCSFCWALGAAKSPAWPGTSSTCLTGPGRYRVRGPKTIAPIRCRCRRRRSPFSMRFHASAGTERPGRQTITCSAIQAA